MMRINLRPSESDKAPAKEMRKGKEFPGVIPLVTTILTLGIAAACARDGAVETESPRQPGALVTMSADNPVLLWNLELNSVFHRGTGDPEETYRDIENGHERPMFVFYDYREAEGHTQRSYDEIRAWVGATCPTEEADSETRAEAARINGEVAGWLLESLEPVVAERFRGTPPITTVHSGCIIGMATGMGAYTGGALSFGTNHLMVCHSCLNTDGEDNMRVAVAHEQLHYAAYLGGGLRMRYRNNDGRAILLGASTETEAHDLREGMTELLAQQIVRAHGHEPTRVGYPELTALAFFLQQIVGGDVLRNAYFTGDLSEMVRKTDEKLGSGAFEEAVLAHGVDSLQTIISKLEAAGIDYSAWKENPIVKLAGVFEEDSD